MIRIDNISFDYGTSAAMRKIHSMTGNAGQIVFHDFSLSLRDNAIYGLLGKNGTGKSTLLYLLSGLLRPQEGSITIDDLNPAERPPQLLSELFLVPEEFDLPAISLTSYVDMIAPFYPRFSSSVLNSCLKDFELPTSLHLGSLSMGEKKKVLMSIALASGTRLLLMDEPTNGLDIPSKSLFRRIVSHYMDSKRTLIISTHQVHDVELLLDHVAILDKHGIIFNSSVNDICSHFTFELRMPGDPMDDVVYSEPTLQGNAVVARRGNDTPETQVNLELLFNAVTKVPWDMLAAARSKKDTDGTTLE
ncbi:MAG: ATP-binding cassette domain-containing protein [Prevotella sp.]